jgi:hypothetical protein
LCTAELGSPYPGGYVLICAGVAAIVLLRRVVAAAEIAVAIVELSIMDIFYAGSIERVYKLGARNNRFLNPLRYKKRTKQCQSW